MGARDPSPTNQKIELWARTFLATEEARSNGVPGPLDDYPGDHLPKTGKVHIPHSCFAPPGFKPASETASEVTKEESNAGVPHSCAGVSPRMGGERTTRNRQRTTNNEQHTTLPTLQACALEPDLDYHGATMRTTSAALLCAASLLAATALAPTLLSAQAAKPAATAHTAATHSVTAHPATHAAATHTAPGGCVKLPEISPKVPALPASAPCAKALYTLTAVPDIRLDYVNPVEGDLAKTLGLEGSSFTLAYIDTKVGTGEPAEQHKYYTVKYTGYLADGTKFDSSEDHPDKSFTFPIGAHQVVAGWDTGFAGMRVGGKRRLFIPFQLAYGPQGRPPTIPARAELIFDMELVSQSDTPPAPKASPAPPTSSAAPSGAENPALRPMKVSPPPLRPPAIPPGAATTPSPANAQPATPPGSTAPATTQPAAAAPGTEPTEKK